MMLSVLFGFGNIFKTIAAFIIKRWRVFLPLAMLVACLWYVHHLQAQRDDAVLALTTLQEEDATAAANRKSENLIKDKTAIAAMNQINSQHQVLIENIKAVDDAKLKDEQKRGINTEKKLTGDIALWRERVRLELEQNTTRLRSLQEPADDTAEIGQDSDTATVKQSEYNTLELACKVTTADYNALWNAWDAACQVYGCSP